ncbi:SDR family NAD(P)-dependent oxidoreductase [Shewanella sp. OMA3-2]|uniref:SDR family NAD(P)-dependent oxidoreductase n=1 Tax=Shewanella sp. OMA3-2 TaxID=2908650 RepID=UPI001F201BA1|nr:SDR family NAD(P)-dependent oxidoreductase [Shewanella sp. OMA3-2]UJF21562.1 SDR family NAD(P)-dependent oxidoreductase [Shewanella sp. OMA3-2]
MSHHQASLSQAVLITGATSGIGLATAKFYAAKGFYVIACGRNEAVLAEINVGHSLVFDITDVEQVNQAGIALKQHIAEKQLQLVQVILNAGTCEYIDDVIEFDAMLFSRVINTNLIAVGHCISAFLPQLAEGGQLGLMSSSATYLPFPRAEAYGASKAAISYLGRSLRLDLAAKSDIGVSVICPGFVNTPLTAKNDFTMPMQISSDQAAQRIFKGMALRKFEIHFPKRFTFILKCLSLLPERVLIKLLADKAVK